MNYDEFKRGWCSGLPETPCGSGSTMAQTTTQRAWIPMMVDKYGIHSIVDVGAGDLNWIGDVNWPHPVNYRAFDLVPRHDSVQHIDIIHDVPPKADLLMCLWVLNHLSEKQQEAAIANINASGCKYIMYTYWPAMLALMDWGADESVIINEGKEAQMRLIHANRLDNLLGR